MLKALGTMKMPIKKRKTALRFHLNPLECWQRCQREGSSYIFGRTQTSATMEISQKTKNRSDK